MNFDDQLFNLKFLNLSSNKISKLVIKAKNENKSLQYINLNYNCLESFNFELFNKFKNISEILFKGNQLNDGFNFESSIYQRENIRMALENE